MEAKDEMKRVIRGMQLLNSLVKNDSMCCNTGNRLYIRIQQQ